MGIVSGGASPVSIKTKAFVYTDFGVGGGNHVIKVCDLPIGALVVATWVIMATAFDGTTPAGQFGVAPAASLTSGSDIGASQNLASVDVEGTFALSANYLASGATGLDRGISLGAAAVILYATWGASAPAAGAGTAYALTYTP